MNYKRISKFDRIISVSCFFFRCSLEDVLGFTISTSPSANNDGARRGKNSRKIISGNLPPAWLKVLPLV